jgi:hypothetical protein
MLLVRDVDDPQERGRLRRAAFEPPTTSSSDHDHDVAVVDLDGMRSTVCVATERRVPAHAGDELRFAHVVDVEDDEPAVPVTGIERLPKRSGSVAACAALPTSASRRPPSTGPGIHQRPTSSGFAAVLRSTIITMFAT